MRCSLDGAAHASANQALAALRAAGANKYTMRTGLSLVNKATADHSGLGDNYGDLKAEILTVAQLYNVNKEKTVALESVHFF